MQKGSVHATPSGRVYQPVAPRARRRPSTVVATCRPREQQTPEALDAYQKAEIEVVANHQGGQHQGE